MDMNNLTKMTDRTPEFDPLDIQNNKAMGILAYIGFLVLVPLLAAPQSKFARYNSSQGLVLCIGCGSNVLGTCRYAKRLKANRRR